MEFKRLYGAFQKHAVHMRLFSSRKSSGALPTALRPISPSVFGYILTSLRREVDFYAGISGGARAMDLSRRVGAQDGTIMPSVSELDSGRFIIRDGKRVSDERQNTVVMQLCLWIDQSPLRELSARNIFLNYLDVRGSGRVTLSDFDNFVREQNWLMNPHILFQSVKKEVPGVVQLDDWLLAVRPQELETEI